MRDTYLLGGIFRDRFSLRIGFLRIFILAISYIVGKKFSRIKFQLSFIFLLFRRLGVFCRSNLLIIFFSYETSLIPIRIIIIVWGSYAERTKGVLLLFIYTLVFSLPFLVILLNIYNSEGSWDICTLINTSKVLNEFSRMLLFMVFAVKLPLLGLHWWLPVAHVEAPTFGSIILARILLKLGGVGLYRFKFLLDLEVINKLIFMFYGIFVIAVFICCRQTDFKKLIAYRSVFHIRVVPALFFINTTFGDKAALVVILIHGVVRPLLFFSVGIAYSTCSTRITYSLTGQFSKFPDAIFLFGLVFVMALPTPPFASFLREIFIFLRIGTYINLLLIALSVGVVFSLVYNLNWFITIIEKNNSFRGNFNFTYDSLLIYFFLGILNIVFLGFIFIL